MATRIYTSDFAPLPHPDPVGSNLSLPEFFAKYNPDNVSASILVHTDTLTGKSLTYGGLGNFASQYAHALRHDPKIALKEGETLLAMGPNSTDFLLLAHSVFWARGVFSPLFKQSFNAGGSEATQEILLTDRYRLSMPGKIIDSITEAVATPNLILPGPEVYLSMPVLKEIARHINEDSSARRSWLASCSQTALKNFDRAVALGAQEQATPPEVLWRLLLANRDLGGVEQPIAFGDYFEAYRAQVKFDLDLEPSCPPSWQSSEYRGALEQL